MKFTIDFDEDQIRLTPVDQISSFLGNLFSNRKFFLNSLSPSQKNLALAIADLRNLADELNEAVEIEDKKIVFSHRLFASIDSETGAKLSLPPFTDLTLTTDAQGVLGSANFKLTYQWIRSGQKKLPQRIGAILKTDRGLQRIPLWMKEAIDIADGEYRAGDAVQWEALARFRQSLDPGIKMADSGQAARLSMTDFLAGLQINIADRFSISPDMEGNNFKIVPFSGQKIDGSEDQIPEAASELGGSALELFQARVRNSGQLNAYRLGQGRFLVIDRGAAPVLRVMSEMQNAPLDERRAFIRNPRPRISAAVEEALESRGELNGLTDTAREELVEVASRSGFVETEEYARFSDRVIGKGLFERPDLGQRIETSTTWLPEVFTPAVAEKIDKLEQPGLAVLRDNVEGAISENSNSVEFSGEYIPANQTVLNALNAKLAELEKSGSHVRAQSPKDIVGEGKIIVKTLENFFDVAWRPKLHPRKPVVAIEVPNSVRTPLKDHQIKSFHWQIAAWRSGLRGILNADEQGLGKTLQTISFLVWLNEQMGRSEGHNKGPILIVAPTSLLENWEKEVNQHVAAPGLGHLIRLYGSGIGARKKLGQRGVDIETGEAVLDFGDITRAQAAGAGHLTWILTTYTTLTNYQHSLANIPFAAAVFDEIQALKNPASLRTVAARAVNADFKIGLTGTPIENSTVDLWAIMDQLSPGSLGSLKEFRERFEIAEKRNMADLYHRIFKDQDQYPALALRRLKDEVAHDLPKKTRYLHPRLMPNKQAAVYEIAREKLASGGLGAALKMLHHIRSVSVHPALDSPIDETFVISSGRLSATFDILRKIKDKGERALVFIEHRQMQYRFIELAKIEFGLSQIDLINGDTPIQKRQVIVDRFQRHLSVNSGFDLLVLGPKAAGTGLTLTAATHVIHLSRWWNPAVEEQCNDRVHRIGQERAVSVHVPMAIHPQYREDSFDCLLQNLMERKRQLASSALWPMGDTENDTADLRQKMTSGEPSTSSGDPVTSAMRAMFNRDGLPVPEQTVDGAWPLS